MRKVYDGLVLTMIALVATVAKDVVVFADSIGVAQISGEVGSPITVDTVGVYEMGCTEADAVAVGNVLYWDATNKLVSTDSDSGNRVRAGIAWSTKAGATAGSVDVKIG